MYPTTQKNVITGILLAKAIERHGIKNIRPINNRGDFSSGLRDHMGEQVLWYEFENGFGWSSSILIPSKLGIAIPNN
jgi:hypothetical protein